jgi:hypothetical protein
MGLVLFFKKNKKIKFGIIERIYLEKTKKKYYEKFQSVYFVKKELKLARFCTALVRVCHKNKKNKNKQK